MECVAHFELLLIDLQSSGIAGPAGGELELAGQFNRWFYPLAGCKDFGLRHWRILAGSDKRTEARIMDLREPLQWPAAKGDPRTVPVYHAHFRRIPAGKIPAFGEDSQRLPL